MNSPTLISVRCIAACVNAAGMAELVPVELDCTQEQFDLGDHYDIVSKWLKSTMMETKLVMDYKELGFIQVKNSFDWTAAQKIR